MDNKKFGRNYILTVESVDGSSITIQPPFTLEFDITRNTLSSANVASFRIYNLNENSRNQIRKDQNDSLNLKKISFLCGYGKQLSVVLSGNIDIAWSERQGSNFITNIEAYDGGFAFANAIVNQQFSAQTTNKAIIKNLVKNLEKYGVQPGAIGEYAGAISRGNSYNGNTADILAELTNGGFFIDNSKAYALGDNESLGGEVQVINSKTGLLGTPVKEQTYVNFNMLFEPRLFLGGIIRIESETLKAVNTDYIVKSLHHRGTISEAVGGPAVTTVGCLPGQFKIVPPERS